MPEDAKSAFNEANDARDGESPDRPTTNTTTLATRAKVAADLQSAVQTAMATIERDRVAKLDAEVAATNEGREFMAMTPQERAREIQRKSKLNKLFGGRSIAAVLKGMGL